MSAKGGVEKRGEPCACCCNNEHVLIAKKRRWILRRCLECGLIFVWPQPGEEQLLKLYNMNEGYFTTAEKDLSKSSPAAAEKIQKILGIVNPAGRKFLDVGCSTGQLMYHLKQFGWEVSGFDINANAVEVAKSNGLDARIGSIEEIDITSESFDVIFMGDVLEHLRSPGRALDTVKMLLKPGGRLIIHTPNAQSSFAYSTLFWSRITGFPWLHSEAPYHLYDFTPNAIEKLLVRKGFLLESILFSGKTTLLYTVGASGFFDGLKQKMKASGKYRFNRSLLMYLPELLAVFSIVFPFWAYSRISDFLNNGGSYITTIACLPSKYQTEVNR